MGDRGNIKVTERGESVFLYSHWGGYRLPETLRTALARKERWDDAPYLTRIIFNTMTKGDEDGETGFGIWTDVLDNEYPILEVDVGEKVVRIGEAVIAFRDYVEAGELHWNDDREVVTVGGEPLRGTDDPAVKRRIAEQHRGRAVAYVREADAQDVAFGTPAMKATREYAEAAGISVLDAVEEVVRLARQK